MEMIQLASREIFVKYSNNTILQGFPFFICVCGFLFCFVLFYFVVFVKLVLSAEFFKIKIHHFFDLLCLFPGISFFYDKQTTG